eukprot:maker-scaffold159_size295958-snap-gene-1.27 protein:Tk05082 transcript:maker-scaffold159_size295958-snap-gene-1.27-mRNA-1 annotation:"macrolide abc transporter atp-binding protein"
MTKPLPRSVNHVVKTRKGTQTGIVHASKMWPTTHNWPLERLQGAPLKIIGQQRRGKYMNFCP